MTKRNGPSPMETPEFLPRMVLGCGHANTETIGENRKWCPDCGRVTRKIRASVLRRRRLLKW